MKNNKTIEFYNEKAKIFAQNTFIVDFSNLQDIFISYLNKGDKILDYGCGSGRDSKYFKEKGFKIEALDASIELCKIATLNIGQNVICSTFQNYISEKKFNGIWACASLLHLNKSEIKNEIIKLSNLLYENGCFYLSFKYGFFNGYRNERYFTDFTIESFNELIKDIKTLSIDKQYITNDVRPNRKNEKWLNIFLIKNKKL